ncbi:MAG: hypothetical protein HY726_09880 [Candidatus Rokubacteria bacterium]|nr:hypothetical protein [Candidatus Rokubacteria bacterium]
MEFLPAFLLRIHRETPGPEGGRGRVYVIIRRAHAYLEEVLRRAFEGQQDVGIVVDRRYGDRRAYKHPVGVERRRADRRRWPKEELLQVVIGRARTP